MIIYENECLNCDLPCVGIRCPNREVPHYHCDICGEEKQLYDFNDRELCLECIESELTKIN